MGKHGRDAARADMYRFDPENLVIPGEKDGLLFDAESEQAGIDDALVRNIMRNGVIEPIEFTRQGDKDVIVNGRRRVRHAREANKRLKKAGHEPVTVPGVPYRGTEDRLFELLVSTNNFRREMLPMEKAKKAASLLNLGKTEEDVAITFGVDPQTVKNWMKIISCSAKVHKAVNDGSIKPTAAAQLSGLSKEDQEKSLEELLDKSTGKATVLKSKKIANKRRGRQETLFNIPTRKEIEAEIKDEGTPKEVREVLLWCVGKSERFWAAKPEKKE